MNPILRVLSSPFRGLAKVFTLLRYDADAYGTGSGDRSMRAGEDAMRHGSVNMGFSSMGNNG